MTPTANPSVTPSISDTDRVERLHKTRQSITDQIGRCVVGQQNVIEHLLIALFAGGHGLFVGVPGLAKTLLINTLAQTLELSFNRIQFTPDLMPSDITGTDIIQQDSRGNRSFEFIRGPIFCNILLADEINRTPPKTQAALLQSMQERQVTAGGQTFDLKPPFHVFATQNPIEQEGTYPLPEAQLDRFMMMMHIDYPSVQDEINIAHQTTISAPTMVDSVIGPDELIEIQSLIHRVPISQDNIELAVRLVRKTRPSDKTATAEIREFATYGAGPRATQHLVLASKARCVLAGRHAVDANDLVSLAKPVLRHRILTNFHAEAQNITPDHLIETILDNS